jgi:hypothetical protein
MREPPLRKTWEYSNITKPHKLWKRLAPGMPGRSYQTKPGLPSGCQVNIKCFYAKCTCLGSNYRNISSLTLVQKVIPGYLQSTVDNYSWAYLWLIPMIFRMVCTSWFADVRHVSRVHHANVARTCCNKAWYFSAALNIGLQCNCGYNGIKSS